jgi:Family of unknown function (DUF5931)/Histidine kinase
MGVASAEPLWRAIAVYRFASIGYAVLLAVINRADYSRPGWAWVVIAVMTAWTAVTTVAYARPERRTPLLLSADLAVTAGLLLSTAALQYPSAMRHGVMPVTAIWVAGPVLAWAVQYGRRAGAIAALVISGCDFLLRSEAITVVLNGVVLLLLAGVVVGHLARLAAEVEAERRHVLEVEAAGRERERLARDIHDSVLQVLAMVQRRGAVTVRDDGPGIADGRLAEAAAAGRLGVSNSICGRLRDLGGPEATAGRAGEQVQGPSRGVLPALEESPAASATARGVALLSPGADTCGVRPPRCRGLAREPLHHSPDS